MNLAGRTINPLTTLRAVYQQPEHAILPYTIDYSAMLAGDTIVSSTWECKEAATLVPSNTDTTATVTVSGAPGRYVIVNTVTTAAGVVEQRTLVVEITQNDEAGARDYQ